MDKNAIKKYAVWARRELISRVAQKALQYGITKEECVPASAATVNGVVLSDREMQQRRALIDQIRIKGYEQVIEEVAYTWFNRFIALRFMEVNGYLPSRVRVFTDENNQFKPQILTEAINLEMSGLSMDRVFELKEANDDEGLFKYLIIVQCNALNPILPGMFQRIADYTELLFPDNLLRDGSVVQQMIEMIDEDDWLDAVQIIGWLYQFYNIEPKAKVFGRPKGTKITKNEIPAATQLFTPDWIVRYMVENSLGRLWVEGHPNDELRAGWQYFLDEAEQEPDVQAQLAEIRREYASITPEAIKCIDPCAGSGHILAYMFDVLMQIYDVYGYTTREAVRSIVENNIFGLDIDERAAQLAYFAVMMKARRYDSRFLARKDENGEPDVPQPRVYAIAESNYLSAGVVETIANGDASIKSALCSIIEDLHDAKEYGSIITVRPVDFEALYVRFEECRHNGGIFADVAISELLPLVQVAEALAQKYDVVVTNPPYMPVSAADPKVYNFAHKNYPDSKTDMFAVFIERCSKMLKKYGYQAMITMHAWMFISSYEKLRSKMLLKDFVNMAHLGAKAFEEIGGEVVQTTSFVLRNSSVNCYVGHYCRLIDAQSAMSKELDFLSGKNRYFARKESFGRISGVAIAYWISDAVYAAYQNYPALGSLAAPRKGNSTSDNKRFLRLWHEVHFGKVNLGATEITREESIQKRWYPYNKGGGYRKWYGFNEYLIDWYDDASAIRAIRTAVIANYQYFMKPGLTWSTLASNDFSIRWFDEGYIFDNGGCCIFELGDKRPYICALLNSSVFKYIFGQLNPTLNFQSGEVAKFPVIFDMVDTVTAISNNNVSISRGEYDDYETSWDFVRHPVVMYADPRPLDETRWGVINRRIADCYRNWEKDCAERFARLKANEEELNRIFIEIYGLQDELTPEVEDRDVTVRLADLGRDIRSLISYAVGCMFGRYSLDVPGLAYAGGEWDESKYTTYPADKDNIIPICDDDYFSDDIVGRFVRFIEVVYGTETLQENLRFIADALGGKGQPIEVIRRYFLNDFYADHLKIYQKRPIYWLFDSGKKGGFRALVYMHRYQPDTIARMRTDYVHEQQSRYRTAIADLEQRIASASPSERVKLSKQLQKLQDQAAEIHAYEEKIHHLADQYIAIDLDDGVKHNYALFGDVLAKIK